MTGSAIALDPVLPRYMGIAFGQIQMVNNDEMAARAFAVLSQAEVLGFDTESKPVFNKGQKSTGPHLIQLATDDAVFLFPVIQPSYLEVLRPILESSTILKVGFGLGDDIKRLRAKLGIQTAHCLDLARHLSESRQKEMGAKAAMAKYFGVLLQKSKSVSTSNWASEPLSMKQMQYAADDAHVALKIYRKTFALNRNNS